jgi:hypothetical protein
MGKKKYIETPEKLYEIFESYIEDCKSRIRRIPKATVKGVVYEDHIPPLTIDGFKTYCNKNGNDINRYWYNIDNGHSEYVTIVTRIKEEIRNDQIEGAIVGQYNNNIVARLNGLKENSDVTTNGKEISEIKINIISGDNKGS